MMPIYTSSEFVCAECFGDKGLQTFVINHAEQKHCDFCGADSDEPIAAPIDEVFDSGRRGG